MAIVVSKSNRHIWILSRVYASTDYKERRILWDEVIALVDQDIPTMVVGDLNCINQPKDKRSGRPYVEDIGSREFGNFLHSNGLMDLGFMGPLSPGIIITRGEPGFGRELINSLQPRMAGMAARTSCKASS